MGNKINFISLESSFLVMLPEEFRNGVWAAQYGPIQRNLKNLSANVEIVAVSATGCKWIDPFPMLSLLISLIEISNEKHIFFIIPDLDASLKEDNKRVLKFLSKEGFLKIMSSHGILIIDESTYGKNIGNNYSQEQSKQHINWINANLNGNLYYNDSTILEASIIDLALYKDENSIENYIENELERVKHRIDAHVPETITNEVLWKITLFLKETVCNVFEHAYDNNSIHKYVGIYVRHRIGMMDTSLSVEERKRIWDLISKEKKDVSRLRTEYPKSESSYLELFVLDSGIGLTLHYMNKTDEKLSFRNAWLDTFYEGKRSKKKPKHTQFGGLYTLGKLLDKDFLLARDYDFWAGDILPHERQNASFIASCPEKNPQKYVLGFAVMSRIGIKAPMNNLGWSLTTKSETCFIDAMKESRDIYDKYFSKRAKQMPAPLAFIQDDRFDISFMKETNYFNQSNNVKFCVLLPSEHISKNMIFYKIDDYLRSISEIDTISQSIIIADIPIRECRLYQDAIEKASFGGEKHISVERIILLSQCLSVCILKRENKTFVRDKEYENNYIENRPCVFSPHLSLFHMIEWLKTHDSMIFWQYVKINNEITKFYVNQEIEWYRDKDKKVLMGYLDFEKTLTDSFLKDMYHNALLRTLCLSSEKDNVYMSDDPLMAGLVNYMNTFAYRSVGRKERQIIALGSVYVSGITQKDNDNFKNINMFLHKDFSKFNTEIKEKNTIYLFAWPNENFFNNIEEHTVKNKNYRRVGSTYSIAPFGWRYFPIPRYRGYDTNEKSLLNGYFFTKNEAEHIEFKSIYKCTPKDTYNYWQGRNGVFMGISHTNYEANHDLLNINFPFIIKESFLLGGDLACFILGELVSAFNIDFDKIDFHSSGNFSNSVVSYCELNKEKYKNRQCSFLVYPFHANTERIIDIIREYIKDNIKMVPLIPLIKERNGTCFQPSPLTIEILKRMINDCESTDINVMLFDDAVVDGKTQEEIKHILFSLGVKHVMSMFVLERRRLPYNTSDGKKNSVFWRLDIPRLGMRNNCPLCAALEIYTTFSSQVISDYAKRRISDWNSAWGVKIANTQERVHAMMPERLRFPYPERQGKKRFGIYFEDEECKQCGGEINKIELISSLGLTLYMGELLSMTSRDDKMLQYCSKDYNLSDHTLLEMLCTNLLLYGNAISHKVREKIVKEIFKRANNIQECNNHTAFAALVLVIQEKEVLLCLREECDKMLKNRKKPNYDIIILLSYLGARYGEVFDKIEDAIKLRRKTLSIDMAYKTFHSELFNDNGKSHNRPIGRMADKAISTTQNLREVEDALDRISYSLNEINKWDLAHWNDSSDDITTDYIKEVKDEISDFKDDFKDENGPLDWESYRKKEDEIQDKLKVLIKKLKSIHQDLFIPLNIIDDNGCYKDEFMLKERISKWCEMYDFGMSKISRAKANGHNIFERWITWDRAVDAELNFLVQNAVEHSGGEITCPVPHTTNEEMHKAWISIEYAEDLSTMLLLLYNKMKPGITVEYIKKQTEKKQRYDKIHLKENLKIIIDYKPFTDNIVITKVTFPII